MKDVLVAWAYLLQTLFIWLLPSNVFNIVYTLRIVTELSYCEFPSMSNNILTNHRQTDKFDKLYITKIYKNDFNLKQMLLTGEYIW